MASRLWLLHYTGIQIFLNLNVLSSDICTNGTGRLAIVKESQCYVVYAEKLSWFNARDKCLFNNGDLASFSDISLLDGIIDSKGSWVGLRHS